MIIMGGMLSFPYLSEKNWLNVSSFKLTPSSPDSLLPVTSAITPRATALGHKRQSSTYSGYHSRSSSLWTAPSPSQVRKSRSPSLPPLPKLQRNGSVAQHFQSPPSHQKTDSSAYFTATWGSPYELPSSSRPRADSNRQQRGDSPITIDGSPVLSSRGNRSQKFLGPSVTAHHSGRKATNTALYLSRTLGTTLAQAASESASIRPRYGFTQEWLRTHLSYRKNLEKGNWWSDDSGDSDTHSVDSGSRQSSGHVSKVPNYLSVGNSPNAKPGQGQVSYHRTLPSDATLKQQDFDDVFCQKISAAPKMDTPMESPKVPRFAAEAIDFQNLGQGSKDGKPLPLPPFNRTASEAPTLMGFGGASETDSMERRPSISSNISFQRPKKRVMWRGRTCVIALPLEDGTRNGNSPKKYMADSEVRDRLVQWENSGYNTAGFDLSESSGTADLTKQGQSRDVYPNPQELVHEWKNKVYRVSIPDRKAWDAYVNFLKEEKLRALGVSFGNEELPTMKPLASSVSRPASFHSSNLQRPEDLSSNSNSRTADRFGNVGSPLSANSTETMHSHPQRVSPAFPPTVRPGMIHLPRQSVSFHGEQPVRLQPQPQYHQLTPGPWHPPNYFGSLPASRGISPGTNVQHHHAHHSVFSTNSLLIPDKNWARDSVEEQSQSFLQHHQQQPMQVLHPVQQVQHQTHVLPQSLDRFDRNEDNTHPVNKFVSQPDIASPVPQGHRQNLSETLQKEIEDAEYHLEESIRRQIDEDDDTQSENAREDEFLAVRDSNGSSSLNGTHKLDRRLDEGFSDLDTNPSLANSPIPDETLMVQDQPFRPGHSSKSSLSKFNVNAQEFVYEPKQSVASDMFALGSKSVPKDPWSNNFTRSEIESRSGDTKLGQNVASGLNVTAPAFTPGNPGGFAVPSRVFSFSSSFEPHAPSFQPNQIQPKKPQEVLSRTGDTLGSDIALPGLFSKRGLPPIVKPTKQSKAIPIVKPVSRGKDRDDEGQEDESGRITQAEGRQKRVRRFEDDGDSVPLFATLTHHLPQEHASHEMYNQSARGEEDVSPIEKATDQLKEILEEILDDFPASDVSSLTIDREAPNAKDNRWEPFEFKNATEAAMFNDARPRSASLSISDSTKNEFEENTKLKDESMTNTQLPSHSHRSSLSATAKPFKHESDILGPYRAHEAHPDVIGDTIKKGELPESKFAPHDFSFTGSQRRNSNEFCPGNEGMSSKSKILDPSNVCDGVTYMDPSYEEIDEVMRHLNAEGSDFGVERNHIPERHRSSRRSPTPVAQDRSGTNDGLRSASQRPSASPNRLSQPFQYLPDKSYESLDSAEAELVARNARFSPSYRPSKHAEESLDSPPIHQLNSLDDAGISDWNNVLDSEDEDKIEHRSGFFDHRVHDLIGTIVKQRLNPLEQSLATMNHSLTKLSKSPAGRRLGRSTSAEVENSDADDEDDDDEIQPRSKSPRKDRKLERLKSSILETISLQQQSTAVAELGEITQTLAELKESVKLQKPSSATDIKTIVEEVVAKQMRGKSAPITSSHESATVEKYQLQIAGLESMLKNAETRAEDEFRSRKTLEDSLQDHQRLLRQAQSEAAEQRESAEETERSLRTFHDERQHALRRTAVLEAAQESLQSTVSELSEKSIALEGTLEEYRLSSTEWRAEVEEAKTENQNLNRTIHALKLELEEGIRGRHALSNKFDRIQDDMAIAARNIARDQSSWRRREEEHKVRHELQAARSEAEARTRERLELEIERLEAQEKEAMKARFLVDHVKGENARLVTSINELRTENQLHQAEVSRSSRELYDAQENGRLEIDRLRISLQTEVQTANQQVKIVRDDFEAVVRRLQTQLENADTDATATKARYELMLEEASESRSSALQEAADAREAALQEHYRFHERTLDELRSHHERALAVVLEEKQRNFQKALEDKQIIESHAEARLALANEKVQHHQDKAKHLEEKLEIAKTAAQAAVQAVQSARGSPSPTASRPSISLIRGSEIPEKISPQALRESIMVLQEQLQEREIQIERLGQELAKVDKDAPSKIKDRDIEITWLRELLGVRIDDLQDIISTLAQPSFNREAVRDAAIRLKANLQMEQQEKERAMAGGQTFPTLSSITNLAASPRALPLAAAAAWGNWRKGQTTFGSLTELADGSASQTPSKPSPSSQSFLYGLLTPPSTNLRPTSQPTSSVKGATRPPISSGHRPLQSYSIPHESISRKDEIIPLAAREEQQRLPPTTPPLLRKTSYDLDAQSPHYSLARYVDEDQDSNADSSVVDRTSKMTKDEEDGPFGPITRT